MNKIVKRMKAALANLVGYRVVVNWEGKVIVHTALTLSDAYEWKACYNGFNTSGRIELA